MARDQEIIEFETESGEIVYVEAIAVDEQDGGYVQAGFKDNIEKKATKTLETALGLITPIANGVVRTIEKMDKKPSEVETKFKIAASSKFDIKLVSLGSDANLEIRILWKDPKR